MSAEPSEQAAAGEPKSEPSPQAKAAQQQASERRSLWLFVGLSFGVAAAVLVGLRLAVGVELDSPTLALALACVVMIWALRAMWGIVVALSRPSVEAMIVEAELGAELSSRAELRDEKRRVLRAIKELEFDHAMGKLSDEDYEDVGNRYRLRAIEVMRALDERDELHPQLLAHLSSIGVAEAQTERAQEVAS